MHQPRKWTMLKWITDGTPAYWSSQVQGCVGGRGGRAEALGVSLRFSLIVSPMQILVVVAIILCENTED